MMDISGVLLAIAMNFCSNHGNLIGMDYDFYKPHYQLDPVLIMTIECGDGRMARPLVLQVKNGKLVVIHTKLGWRESSEPRIWLISHD